MKIAIAGFGIEGKSSYNYFSSKYPSAEIVIIDERDQIDDLPVGARAQLGKSALDGLLDFDIVMRSPSLAPNRIVTNGKVWSATNEFFDKVPAKIIGVTGTKGKGTTCSLIASILRSAGKTVHLVGNIGVSALDILPKIRPDDIVIYELSSFQLWDLKKSPQIAVVLMIEPDHLDVHADFDEYVTAKTNITAHQTVSDIVIYHPTNKYSRQIAERTAGAKQRYAAKENGGVYVLNDAFYAGEDIICGVDTLHLVGAHNQENACAAISAVKKILPEATSQQIASGLSAFEGLPHRLKFVAEKNGVKYYDDSIATTPGSAVVAIRSFNQPKILILGGHDKGSDYRDLVREITQTDSVKTVLLIGSNADKLAELFDEVGASSRIDNLGIQSMTEIVQFAKKCTESGDVVILSPASASFDMFDSYHDRGDQFMKAVEEATQNGES